MEIRKNVEEKLEYLRDKEPEIEIRKKWKKNWNIHEKRNQRWRSEKNLKEKLEYLGDKEPEMKIRKKLERKS